MSEILALRRDQEEKTRLIESLEFSLHTTREQHESVQGSVSATAKENRSLKRQLALLEGGTSSALGELARERDEAVDNLAETRKRLDTAQKKVRSQEDDSQRVHDLYAQEKDNWEDEKRKYERKIHVADSRLKVVLDEVAAFQAAHANGTSQDPHGHDSDIEESAKDNDAASIRTMSMTNSIRFSLINGPGSNKPNGHSLADELNFDGDDDEQSDADGRESVLSNHTPNRHTRKASRESVTNRPHRRNLSLESLMRSGSVARNRFFVNQSVLEALEGEEEKSGQSPAKVAYTDTGIQFSPPPSPKPQLTNPTSPERPTLNGKSFEPESPSRDSEIEANQRRKRVQIGRFQSFERLQGRHMVSASSQTADEPLSPPRTPKSQLDSKMAPEIIVVSTATSSTQTDSPPAPRDSLNVLPLGSSVPIPSISVQPPTSRPTTPREPLLPQYFKHFGCQVNLSAPVSTNDVGIQTEGIQIDKRLALLPPHLQPSAISSRPTSPAEPTAAEHEQNFTPVPSKVPPRNPRRLAGKRDSDGRSSPMSQTSPGGEELHDAYPGNNDDGPLSNGKMAPSRRPHRFSSLFAGFDTASSDEGDEFADPDFSDSEYRTALSAPRPPSLASHTGKRSSVGTAPTSPEQPTKKSGGRNSVKAIGTEVYSSFSLPDKENASGRAPARSSRPYEKSSGPPPSASSRASVMRKAAMIQNGLAGHQGRVRSPSLPETDNPPFPIPTRASSRRLPFSASAPSDGQRSPTRYDTWHRSSTSRSTYRSNSIRKVRSTTALPRSHRYRRHGSRSPPPLSPSTEAPESPGLPPLPRNDLTTPRMRERGNSYKKHRHELSNNTDNTNNTDPASVGSGTQTPGVVDAIAQTMVGEWMFKYVRRRKSFGVPESNAKDDNNDRHKRWVWLAPYERAILWSSKQPSSGSALMGKTGRKRKSSYLTILGVTRSLTRAVAIQSVLDVKDDNPAPKGSPTVFNRSILILTPQRALKFTATSAERHYVWLTALSFLAHSSQAVPEIAPAPQLQVKQQPLPEMEAPRPKSRRPGIRDSIRLAKGKATGIKGTPSIPSIPSIPSAPSSNMGDVAGFRGPESIGAISSSHAREPSRDVAEPPFIPRFHDRAAQVAVHGRKRSNTGGHVPPPLSFRGFSGPVSSVHNSTNSTAGASINTAGSSDIYQSQASSNVTWGMSQTASQRTSEASSRPSNFFDAIGTVRMEAFISPLAQSGFGEVPDEHSELRQIVRRRSKEMRRRNSRSRHRDSYASRGTRGTDEYFSGSRTAGEEEYYREDPFRGF